MVCWAPLHLCRFLLLPKFQGFLSSMKSLVSTGSSPGSLHVLISQRKLVILKSVVTLTIQLSSSEIRE